MKNYSRSKVLIDLDTLLENVRQMKANIKKGTKMVGVVKADAYGHGSVTIARLLQEDPDFWGFAVATVAEAQRLREGGICKPILLLGYAFEEDFAYIVKEELRSAIFQLDTARMLSDAAVKQGKKAKIHLALDTGMGRIGLPDREEGIQEALEIARLPGLEIEGIFSHFARADEISTDPAQVQLDRYGKFVHDLEKAGLEISIHHISNSAGIMQFPKANLHMVRAGISLYGLLPSMETSQEAVKPQPILSWKTHIVHIKTLPAGCAISYGGTYVTTKATKVATIPIGYADGYPRMLSNKGYVLIRGQRAPILGRVCMDQFMVDVSGIAGADRLDEVTLVGRDGEEVLTMEYLGQLSGRFNYEFACCINQRIPRVYMRGGLPTGDVEEFSQLNQ